MYAKLEVCFITFDQDYLNFLFPFKFSLHR